MFKKIKTKKAFTLAEVLITLVIIGVVAALTIPTAINKYKEQELKSQFVKAYSTITQALNKTEMYDFYGYARCYYYKYPTYLGRISNDCNAFFNALVKNLQVQKACKSYSGTNDCVPEYQSYYTKDANCPAFAPAIFNSYNSSYVLSDGQILIIYGAHEVGIFLLDVNGHKGPNAYGKDLFAFRIERDGTSGVYLNNSGTCEFPVSGGRTTSQMIQYALVGKN